MAASLALKRLFSSSNILPSSMRVVRPMATGPSTSRLSSINANGDRDERQPRGVFDPLSPTRRSLGQVFLSSMAMKGEAKESNETGKNILRPLSPHLPVYQPQLNSTLSISNRISGVLLTVVCVLPYFLSLKMGSVCLTNSSFYQFLFYSSKLLPVTGSIAAVALIYHTIYGVRHLIADVRGR